MHQSSSEQRSMERAALTSDEVNFWNTKPNWVSFPNFVCTIESYDFLVWKIKHPSLLPLYLQLTQFSYSFIDNLAYFMERRIAKDNTKSDFISNRPFMQRVMSWGPTRTLLLFRLLTWQFVPSCTTDCHFLICFTNVHLNAPVCSQRNFPRILLDRCHNFVDR